MKNLYKRSSMVNSVEAYATAAACICNCNCDVEVLSETVLVTNAMLEQDGF